MWCGVLVEVRGYYQGACPSATEVLRVELWRAKWGQTRLPPSHLASPVSTFQGRVLAVLLKRGYSSLLFHLSSLRGRRAGPSCLAHFHLFEEYDPKLNESAELERLLSS